MELLLPDAGFLSLRFAAITASRHHVCQQQVVFSPSSPASVYSIHAIACSPHPSFRTHTHTGTHECTGYHTWDRESGLHLHTYLLFSLPLSLLDVGAGIKCTLGSGFMILAGSDVASDLRQRVCDMHSPLSDIW